MQLEKLWVEMRHRKFEPDAATYCSLIKANVRSTQVPISRNSPGDAKPVFSKAEQLLRTMQVGFLSTCHETSPTACRNVTRGCAQ
jgi:hypothetical protein